MRTTSRHDANWGILFEVINPASPRAVLADDLELPYATDLNVSMRWGLPRSSGSVTLSYIDRDYKNLLEAFVGDQGTTVVPVPGSGESVEVDTIVWDNAAQAERRYQAIAATWDYRPGFRWNLGGSWTYGETTGNVEEVLEETGLGSAIETYGRSRPEAAAVPFGNLATDIRHRFNLWGNYRFDLGRAGALVLGALATYQSGAPWNRSARVRFSPDPDYLNEGGFNRYTHYFDGRGNNRFDDWSSFDLSARYQLPIFRRLDGWLKVNVVNVFNDDALISFDTTASAVPDAGTGDLEWQPEATFGTPRTVNDYQVPRRYQLTLGLAF